MPRDIAEKVAGIREQADPSGSAHDVVGQKLPISHLTDAGKERSERAHHRYEAADDDGETAVLFIKTMGTLHVLGLQPAAEPRFVRTQKDLGTDEMTDGVVDGISKNR